MTEATTASPLEQFVLLRAAKLDEREGSVFVRIGVSAAASCLWVDRAAVHAVRAGGDADPEAIREVVVSWLNAADPELGSSGILIDQIVSRIEASNGQLEQYKSLYHESLAECVKLISERVAELRCPEQTTDLSHGDRHHCRLPRGHGDRRHKDEHESVRADGSLYRWKVFREMVPAKKVEELEEALMREHEKHRGLRTHVRELAGKVAGQCFDVRTHRNTGCMRENCSYTRDGSAAGVVKTCPTCGEVECCPKASGPKASAYDPTRIAEATAGEAWLTLRNGKPMALHDSEEEAKRYLGLVAPLCMPVSEQIAAEELSSFGYELRREGDLKVGDRVRYRGYINGVNRGVILEILPAEGTLFRRATVKWEREEADGGIWYGLWRLEKIRDDGKDKPGTEKCWCFECDEALIQGDDPIARAMLRTRVNTCPACGYKRCPRATDHRFACTASDAHGQWGSRYGVTVASTTMVAARQAGTWREALLQAQEDADWRQVEDVRDQMLAVVESHDPIAAGVARAFPEVK